MKENTLKSSWNAGRSNLGLWLTAGDPTAIEHLADIDLDYICFDLQHGVIDYQRAVSGLQALRPSKAVPVARAPWNEPGIIGKLLDAGAMGVIIPMVNTVEEARAAVRACRYAPAGSRSYGPTRANIVLGPDYYSDANEQVACIPMIETKTAVENLEAIVEVEGIDAVYVGPADLAVSFGLPPGSDNPDPAYQAALAKVVEVCTAKGIAPGIHTHPGLVQTRLDQGFTMVTVTADILALSAGVKAALAVARGEVEAGSPGAMY